MGVTEIPNGRRRRLCRVTFSREISSWGTTLPEGVGAGAGGSGCGDGAAGCANLRAAAALSLAARSWGRRKARGSVFWGVFPASASAAAGCATGVDHDGAADAQAGAELLGAGAGRGGFGGRCLSTVVAREAASSTLAGRTSSAGLAGPVIRAITLSLPIRPEGINPLFLKANWTSATSEDGGGRGGAGLVGPMGASFTTCSCGSSPLFLVTG
jgi:hypothetical protein